MFVKTYSKQSQGTPKQTKLKEKALSIEFSYLGKSRLLSRITFLSSSRSPAGKARLHASSHNNRYAPFNCHFMQRRQIAPLQHQLFSIFSPQPTGIAFFFPIPLPDPPRTSIRQGPLETWHSHIEQGALHARNSQKQLSPSSHSTTVFSPACCRPKENNHSASDLPGEIGTDEKVFGCECSISTAIATQARIRSEEAPVKRWSGL